MSPLLLKIFGLLLLLMGGWGLLTGRVMAGSRGLRPNYYTRNENPILYSLFIAMYVLAGLFVLVNSP